MASTRVSAELSARGRDGAALVRRIAGGDESAFAALYDTTCGLIYGLLLRILGNSATADQVMASIYLEVWEQAAVYDEREKPMTWLVTMAHRRAVARLRADRRSQPRQPSTEAAEHTPTAGSKTDEITSAEQQSVRSAFAGLSPAQRQVIELAYFSGLRPDEIGARLGLSPQSAQAELRAGAAGLRDALESVNLVRREAGSPHC